MSLDMKIDLTASGKRKTDIVTYLNILSDVIQSVTLEGETQCKKEAPVQTGALRNSINSDISKTKGNIRSRVDYALDVVYGRGAYTSGDRETKGNIYFNEDLGRETTSFGLPNNFPQRAVNNLKSSNVTGQAVKKSFKKYGVE